MSCKHPDALCADLLLDYAAGSLDRAHSLMVAAYLTLSPDGRRYVRDCEALGGALVEHLCDPVDVSDDCLDRVMAMIDCADGTDCAGTTPCCATAAIDDCRHPVPAPIAALFGPTGVPRWRRAFGGMSWVNLPVADCRTSRLRLIRCAPGFRTPHHSHSGYEITLVLEGAFIDGNEQYRRGDLIIRQEGTAHAPHADPVEGCMCFTLSARPIRFTGVLTRLLNPFV